MGRIIGVDIGNKNSKIAVLQNGIPVLIPNQFGYDKTPSVVNIDNSGKIVVGNIADTRKYTDIKHTFFSFVREIGTNYKRIVNGKTYLAEDVYVFLLQQLKEDAEAFLSETVTGMIITVPAYFDLYQMKAVEEAGKKIGVSCVRVISDSIAAALSYGYENTEPQNILVCDIGDGTTSMSIAEVFDGVVENVASVGDNHLGGEDYDQKIVDYLIEGWKRFGCGDISGDVEVLQQIRKSVGEAKENFESVSEAEIVVPYYSYEDNKQKYLRALLTRETFECLTKELTERIMQLIQKRTKDIKIEKVLLTGGGSHVPVIKCEIEKKLGIPVRFLNNNSVAFGAAIQGGKLEGCVNDIMLLDSIPWNICVVTKDGNLVPLINGNDENTSIPTKNRKIFTCKNLDKECLDIHIVQENPVTKEVISLVRIRTNIAAKDKDEIDIAIEIDANTKCTVNARNCSTEEEIEIKLPMDKKMFCDEVKHSSFFENGIKYK